MRSYWRFLSKLSVSKSLEITQRGPEYGIDEFKISFIKLGILKPHFQYQPSTEAPQHM